MHAPQAAVLPGNRLHLQHGPIDLVITAEGERDSVERACEAARQTFPGVLPRLVEELPALRSPIGETMPSLRWTRGAAHGGSLLALSCPIHHAHGGGCRKRRR